MVDRVATGGERATVTPYPDGPLLVRGDFVLVTPDGETIDPGRRTVALCRCGRSAIKPFCDGTHKVVKFRAGTGRGGTDQLREDAGAASSDPVAGPDR
jgi:CDGSH-type Zn-finger protein